MPHSIIVVVVIRSGNVKCQAITQTSSDLFSMDPKEQISVKSELKENILLMKM